MSLIDKILRAGEGRTLKKLDQLASQVDALQEDFEKLSDAELQAKTAEFKERLENGETLDDILVEAFATVREAAWRILHMRPFHVQVMGGIALHKGNIAEMKTGEGKTLVATMPAYLRALTGKGVHVVTVNDYLAKRDSEWMGKVYGFLGMSAGCLQNDMDRDERRDAYAADVTYGTNSEFGFDYLRDHMVMRANQRVQRGHAFAIVDDADSILIDEARTPLIISGVDPTPVERYIQFARAVEGLSEDDVSVDEAKHTVYATEEGLRKIEWWLGLDDLYSDLSGQVANHLRQALRARFLFHRDDQYVVAEGKVKIVDEFTGRILKGRRYSEGLHQAIEAKEGVEVLHESMTIATVTLQNYLRLYDKLSGMTGTAKSADAELRETYGTPVVTIPTNRPVIREDREDYVFLTRRDKLRAVVDEVGRRHEKGQPVLVGTTSVEASEELDRLMGERGIPHQTLNAKDPGREAAIVANAGKVGAVTIATNMAGRGTDIILGGSREGYVHERLRQLGVRDPESALSWQLEQAEEYARTQMRRQGDLVRNLGGLLVIGTERHDSRRIDDQLRGRSGRQGDPGESRFYLSLEDRLLRLYGRGRLDAMSRVMRRAGWGEGEPAEDRRISAQVTKAQERVESMHHGTRKQVLDYDDVMDRQRRAVYAERDAILDGADIGGRAIGHARDIIGAIIEETCGESRRREERDVDGLNAWVGDMTGDESFDAAELGEGAGVDELADAIEAAFAKRWDAQKEAMGEEAFGDLCRRALLRSLDQHWVDHLVDMDHLKQGMGLRGLAQRDPLVEYKSEAFHFFGDFVREVYADLLRTILRLKVEGGVKADEVAPEEENPFREENLSYSKSGESTIQDESDLSTMADIAGEVDIEADD